MAFAFFMVKAMALVLIYGLRSLGWTMVFAWRHPWMFMAGLLALPVLLAAPEYIR